MKQFDLWFPVVVWAYLIFNFSSGRVPVASTVFWQDFAVKKTGHMLLFGALAMLIYRGLLGENIPKKKAAIWAVILAFFYGASDEFHQMFTQGREARVRDVAFDTLGASLVIFLTYRFLQKLPKKVQFVLKDIGFE